MIDDVITLLCLLALTGAGLLFALFPTQLVKWNGLGQRLLSERLFRRSVDSLPPDQRDFVHRAIDAPESFMGRIVVYRIGGIAVFLASLAAWCLFGPTLGGG